LEASRGSTPPNEVVNQERERTRIQEIEDLRHPENECVKKSQYSGVQS
jgi:hypothetical protein